MRAACSAIKRDGQPCTMTAAKGSDYRYLHDPDPAVAERRPLVVGASVWVLGTAQRRLDRPPGRTGRALARSAFAAFVLQGIVLIGVALALRPAELPAEVKAAAVAAVGVAGSFMLAWVLVIRTPIGRIL